MEERRQPKKERGASQSRRGKKILEGARARWGEGDSQRKRGEAIESGVAEVSESNSVSKRGEGKQRRQAQAKEGGR